jgi:hypothetical protein
MKKAQDVGDHLLVLLPDGSETKISKEDAHLLDAFPWWRRSHRHAKICRKNPTGEREDVWLHRMILDPGPGMVTHHINGDGLDNRRENLVVVTHRENSIFKGKARKCITTDNPYKGVFYRPSNKKRPWQAFVSLNEQQHHIGYFSTRDDAATAVDGLTRLLFGRLAHQNVPA